MSIAKRVGSSILVGVVGAVLGRIGAFGVWGFIYGIGGRVITDRTYYELESTVVFFGLIIGAISGTLLGLAYSPMWKAALASLLLAIFCVFWGCVGGDTGWQTGLYAFFGGYFIAIAICTFSLARHLLCR